MADKRAQRRLAAILAADVVGYSRMMREDEEGTLEELRAIRDKIIEPKVSRDGGRIVKTTGDGFLIEFSSAVDATRCALDVQSAISTRNEEIQANDGIALRMGINLGDVIVEDGDLYGDGVNIASRLEGLCEPGEVFVSAGIHDQIEGKLSVDFQDLGEHPVKNIDKPVHVYRAVAKTDSGSLHLKSAAAVLLPQKPTIAVLPFANISGDAEQEYFADGLTEDLITALTYWRSFPVIARNSCFTYKDRAVDIKQAARDLGARYILEGSVRKGGNRVRITAQLIDGSTGQHIWAEKYDRDLEDIFEVQDEIVQRITAVVVPELDKAELERLTAERPEDLDAWDLCLRAKPHLRERTREGNASALELFRRAIEIRGDYSDAHSGLAQALNQEILMGATEERAATANLAMEAALDAIKYDGASSWAHHELSTAYQWLNRIDDALDEARTAVDLNPHDAYALRALGNKSDLAGDPDGIACMEKAQKLNPEDAQRHTHLTFLARAYLSAGDYDSALDRARQAIRRRSDFVPAHYVMGIALAHLGQLQEARTSLETCDELSPGFVESRKQWQPYSDPQKNKVFSAGLRKIGLLE